METRSLDGPPRILPLYARAAAPMIPGAGRLPFLPGGGGEIPEIEKGKFKKVVRPGERVACFAQFGEEGYFRGNKLVAEVEIQFEGGPKDGETIFEGLASGMWVPRDSEAMR